jgi:hypothetical protein
LRRRIAHGEAKELHGVAVRARASDGVGELLAADFAGRTLRSWCAVVACRALRAGIAGRPLRPRRSRWAARIARWSLWTGIALRAGVAISASGAGWADFALGSGRPGRDSIEE